MRINPSHYNRQTVTVDHLFRVRGIEFLLEIIYVKIRYSKTYFPQIALFMPIS